MGDSHSSTVPDSAARAPVWVYQSRSGALVESTESHRHWTPTVLSSLSRTGRTTGNTRARPPAPARSNPRPRPTNHRTGHFSNRQVASITRPATGRAQPERNGCRRPRSSRGHYINIHFHAYPYSHMEPVVCEMATILSRPQCVKRCLGLMWCAGGFEPQYVYHITRFEIRTSQIVANGKFRPNCWWF